MSDCLAKAESDVTILTERTFLRQFERHDFAM